MVIPALLPVTELVVAVTTCVTPTLTLVVNAIVATPLEFVGLVGAANDPPFVLDHVTVVPAVETALPFTSANCAEIVTAVPAAGDWLFDVTRYCVAGPATDVIVPVVPVRLLASVAVIV